MAERILVVDYEERIRKIIISILRLGHYEFREAVDGLEVLALLESGEQFDLVISDIMMPNEDGIGLLERIKGKYPDLPLMLVTRVYDRQVKQLAIRMGAYDYILKSYKSADLLAMVRRTLETRRPKRGSDSCGANREAAFTTRTQKWQMALASLEQSYDLTVEALGHTLDGSAAEAKGHSKRVTAYTIAIARKMGLPKEEITVIARGAFLHDIGKIAIPDDIVRKPGKLTSDEAKIMLEHCFLGYKIISGIPFLAEAAEIVYSHHERYDGSGYPRGLKGDEIPLGARIFAVADTLDSITSDLPYREAQSFDDARAEIVRGAAHQFDPEIVSTFLDMPENIWEDLRKDIDAGDNPMPPSDPPK